MRLIGRITRYFIVTLFVCGCAGTRKPLPPLTNEISADCLYNANINVDSIKNTFPFNKAHSIQLVSYEYYGYDTTLDKNLHSIITYNNPGVSGYTGAPHNGKVEVVKWKETTTLTAATIKDLQTILYGYSFNPNLSVSTSNGCYLPRNAVLFYDQAGAIIAALEICFQCKNTRVFPKEFNIGDACEEKFALLELFFLKHDIIYVKED